MAVRTPAAETAWERGRLDARHGPNQLLFGRMHEDSAIELAAFAPGGRVFCIASAGCTAMALSQRHEVVAADINPMQVAYVRARIAGAAPRRGTAERLMALARAFAPLVGWRRSLVAEFLDMDEPAAQIAFWRQRLDTRRFRAGLDLLLSRGLLEIVYAKSFLIVLPPRFGEVLRARMERCFARHPNRGNPYARALLLGELPDSPPAAAPRRIELVCSEAAEFLEGERPGSFNGFTLSNILDGAAAGYRTRLAAAVRHAAAPGAVAVLRSFGEPAGASTNNLAADDLSMLWGTVEVAPAEVL
jgi:S-adenosylmethionine:diacylglycerol 3-amino-3-carboxypropyl transferase